MGESYLRRKLFNRQSSPPSPKQTSIKATASSKLRGAFRAVHLFRRAADEAQPPAGINNSAGAAAGLASGSSASSRSHSQESQSSAGAQAPQFIVPKMNALRLPLVCRIRSLEGELMREVFVHRYEEGRYLIESLKVSVGLQDDKYFGLKMARSSDDQEDLRNAWLTLADSVCKQLKSLGQQQQLARPQKSGPRAVDFYLRIKFYPPNLGRVQDQFLRNYLWLQLRRDLRLGKLISSANNLCQLMACVCQCELGDYRPELVARLSELNVLPNQDLIEARAVDIWRTRLVGLQRHQAQMQFLRAAVILETYGFDYYQVRDHQRQRQYLLGFNYAGVKTIRNGRIVHHFSWHSMSKISLENRMIIFHIYPTASSKRKQVLGFKCLSQEECKSLYMRLLEQKYFFTIELAYFDKSVRRPSCLYSSGGSSSANQLSAAAAWDARRPPSGQSSQDLLGEAEGIGAPTGATRHAGCGPSLERDRSSDSSLTRPVPASDCGRRLSGSLSPSPATPTRSEQPAGESPQTHRSSGASRLQRQQATIQYLGRGNGSEEADEEDELEEENPPPIRGSGSDLEHCWRLASDRLWPWARRLEPAARLCGTLVIMSLLLRWTDSMSNYLLDLIK